MLLRLMEMANAYGHADLGKIFEDAVSGLPAHVREDLLAEKERWRLIYQRLDEVSDIARKLVGEEHPMAERLWSLHLEIGKTAGECQRWSWRNQR
jgi:hypothetical protein